MHIVIIPAFFQTKDRPTLGSFFLDQAKALKKQGHEVTVLYCDTYSVKCFPQWIAYEEKAESQIAGIQIYRKKSFCPLKHGMEGHKEVFAKGIWSLWQQHMTTKKVDIIHAHCAVWAGYAAMRLSEKAQIPYVVTEHATLFQLHKEEISAANREVIKKIFTGASRVVCVSRAFGELLSDYRKNIEVIGNVVDFDLFQPKEQKERQTITFLTVCYMDEEAQLKKKGMDILIQAWAKIHQSYPNVKLRIGGGGKALEIAKKWVNEAQITDSVEFLGKLDRKQVVLEMQNCDCFVLPSRYETFGVVYVEAMASGKPVIAVANGGPDDFVNETNGILISGKEEEMTGQLTKAMVEIINHVDKYDAIAIRDSVRKEFSMEAIAAKLENLYHQIEG